jgi:DNA polymerase-1
VVIRPRTKEAYHLFHEGSLAFAEAEFNGIRCDRDYVRKMINNTNRQLARVVDQLDQSELGRVWRDRFGSSASYGSDHQLRKILIEDFNIQTEKKTAKGNVSMDSEVLNSLDMPDLKLVLKKRSLEKMSSTYLKNLWDESEADGYIHPFFHLAGWEESKGGAASLRSSSSDPNFQNLPNRHEEERKLIRRAFIPRDGHRLVSRDYGSMEVRISACLHQDQNMIRYIEAGDDMHRDCASMCFMLPQEECTSKYGKHGKHVRFVGKNTFTFAQFYFQEPANSAKGLWKSMIEMDLRVPSDPDKTIRQHLRDKKIRDQGSFEKHIIKVAKEFWEVMFPGYWKWRLRWIDEYNKNGYFDMVTGFRIEGNLTQYQLANYPIQGPAFHCLLWSMIRVVKRWKGRRSKVVGQIHDELTTDEHQDEFEENQGEVPRIMSQDIRKAWPWIIVPLEVETEATGVDEAWYYKKGV